MTCPWFLAGVVTLIQPFISDIIQNAVQKSAPSYLQTAVEFHDSWNKYVCFLSLVSTG